MKKLMILFIGLIGFLSIHSIISSTNLQAETASYDVTFQSTFDASNPGTADSLGLRTYGSTIQLETNVTSATENGSGFEDYVFAFWVVNGVVRRDLLVNHTFIVIGNMDIIAVFSKSTENAVLFMDSNAKLIEVQYVLNGADASDAALTLPDKPGYIVSLSSKWSGSTLNITEDTVLTLQYDKQTTDTFSLSVTGGSGTGTYNYNDIVTVVASVNGTPFSHWEDDTGVILSTEASYTFSILQDKTVIAIFNATAETDAPRVILSNDLTIRTGYNSYLTQFYLPTGYTLIDYGLLTLTEDKPIIDIDTPNVFIHQGFKYFGETNEFLMSLVVGSHYSVRAYLVVADSENVYHRYYSELNIQYTHQGPVDLGLAYNFAILSKTAISATVTTHVTGDIGLSPAAASYITGFGLIMDSTNEFSTSSLVTGKIYAADYTPPTPSYLTTAVSNMETAYTDAASRAPDHTDLYTGDISGQTLAPGVYKWNTSVTINTDVTLNGSATDTWIFQITGNLTQAATAKIILTGGAVAENIVWQVASDVTIGSNAHFEGTILCMTQVILQTGASLNGRILAQTATTLDANKVN